jgi:hypothetical protein
MQLTANAGSSSGPLAVLVVLPAAVATALGVAWLAERALKRFWPSRRALRVDEIGLELSNRGQIEVALGWSGKINVLAWRFTVPPRRGRVQKGWYCMAVRLTQDEQVVTLYAFVPPDEAKALAQFDHFTALVSRKTWEKATPAERLTMGEQTRLYSAEAERWDHGAELTREHFAALVDVMGARIEGWADERPGARAALIDEAEDKLERPPSKGDGKPIQL